MSFLFTALEAFANEEIPDEYHRDMEDDRGVVVSRDKDWIENHTSLDEKLSRILPEIMDFPSPKGKKVWDKYVTLRKMRHRIIHLKSKDRITSKDTNAHPKTLWSDMLRPDVMHFPLTAKEMMLYFEKDGEESHWLQHCPF